MSVKTEQNSISHEGQKMETYMDRNESCFVKLKFCCDPYIINKKKKSVVIVTSLVTW